METLRRIAKDFLSLYGSMTPSQRGTLIVVPLLVIAGFGVILYNGQASSSAALSWGKVFTTEELAITEQTLIQAGLKDFHREGQRIMVPAKDVDRYNAALAAEGGLPNSTSEWEEQFNKTNAFTTPRQMDEYRSIALRNEIRRVLRAVPEIEDATVIWARPQARTRWPDRPKVTATVNIRPRRGRELSTSLVESLRSAVANMIPDLDAEGVTVFNQLTGKAYTSASEDSPYNSELLTRIDDFKRSYQQSIDMALSYIPEVLVTVHVELENIKSMVENTRELDQKKTVVVRAVENRVNKNSTQRPNSAEPGQVSNAPRQLQTNAGNVKMQTSDEEQTDTLTWPSVTITRRELLAAMPKAVQVTVSIPEDYYEAVALKQGVAPMATAEEIAAFKATDEFKATVAKLQTSVEADVKAKVSKLIPGASPDEAVEVRSHVAIAPNTMESELPMTETVSMVVSRWGSTIGLALFAVWALRMVNKSLGKVPPADEPPPPQQSHAALDADDDDDEEEPKPPELSRRDQLQLTVRDNPELAAIVLSKWIESAR